MIIKDIRSVLKLSQQALSNQLGIPKGRIAQWEVGNGSPKIEDLNILQTFFINNEDEIATKALNISKGDKIARFLGYIFPEDDGYDGLRDEILNNAKNIESVYDLDYSIISKEIWKKPEFLEDIVKGKKEIHRNIIKALNKKFPTAQNRSIRRPKTETKDDTVPAFDRVVAQQGQMIESLIPTTQTDKAGLVKKEMFRNAQFVIRSAGNSMIPNYPPDAWIGIRRVDTISPGSVYALDIGSDLILKRIYWKDDDQHSGIIECFSDNTMEEDHGPRKGRLKYPPYEIDASKIKGVYKVTDVYRPNEVTVIS